MTTPTPPPTPRLRRLDTNTRELTCEGLRWTLLRSFDGTRSNHGGGWNLDHNDGTHGRADTLKTARMWMAAAALRARLA